MDAVPGLSLYPLHRCKIVHLVRHAQGIHNIEGAEKDKRSPKLFDACLSPLGWEQVENLRKHVNACGLLKRIQLVIVSPLLRTMQTAAIVFGGDIQSNSISANPLMVENVKSEHAAVSTLDCPPFIAHELCRERLGINTADKRRSISEYKNLFPAIDFSLVESNDDIMWAPDVRESDEELAARGIMFLKWLWTRKEEEIAIVTHSAFLLHTLLKFGDDCHPSVKNEMCEFFRNCGLRSLVLVDKGLVGSDAATTNHPGKVPVRLELPSDLADENQESNGQQQNGKTDLPSDLTDEKQEFNGQLQNGKTIL